MGPRATIDFLGGKPETAGRSGFQSLQVFTGVASLFARPQMIDRGAARSSHSRARETSEEGADKEHMDGNGVNQSCGLSTQIGSLNSENFVVHLHLAIVGLCSLLLIENNDFSALGNIRGL